VCGKSADLSDIQYVRDALHAVFSDARLSREWRVLRRWAASRYKGQERSYEYTVYQKTLGFQHPYVVEERHAWTDEQQLGVFSYGKP